LLTEDAGGWLVPATDGGMVQLPGLLTYLSRASDLDSFTQLLRHWKARRAERVTTFLVSLPRVDESGPVLLSEPPHASTLSVDISDWLNAHGWRGELIHFLIPGVDPANVVAPLTGLAHKSGQVVLISTGELVGRWMPQDFLVADLLPIYPRNPPGKQAYHLNPYGQVARVGDRRAALALLPGGVASVPVAQFQELGRVEADPNLFDVALSTVNGVLHELDNYGNPRPATPDSVAEMIAERARPAASPFWDGKPPAEWTWHVWPERTARRIVRLLIESPSDPMAHEKLEAWSGELLLALLRKLRRWLSISEAEQGDTLLSSAVQLMRPAPGAKAVVQAAERAMNGKPDAETRWEIVSQSVADGGLATWVIASLSETQPPPLFKSYQGRAILLDRDAVLFTDGSQAVFGSSNLDVLREHGLHSPNDPDDPMAIDRFLLRPVRGLVTLTFVIDSEGRLRRQRADGKLQPPSAELAAAVKAVVGDAPIDIAFATRFTERQGHVVDLTDPLTAQAHQAFVQQVEGLLDGNVGWAQPNGAKLLWLKQLPGLIVADADNRPVEWEPILPRSAR
jgi:hypothetical protein